MNPVLFEVMRHSVEGIPERMGVALQRSAFSANIKERKDESCALFCSRARMIAQAEHIPVHLGAMPSALEQVISSCTLGPEDQIMLNDPYKGGTHLPDITVVSPVFIDKELMGYVVNRAHHADVGGSTPGSMPGDSEYLQDEGVVIPPVHIVRGGKIREEALEYFSDTRNPRERRGDLMAQIGANKMGARELNELIGRVGVDTYLDYAETSLGYSETRTRKAIALLPRGTFHVSSAMGREEEVILCLKLTIGDHEMLFDFNGTSEQVRGNINAPLPVSLSAVYYVVRCLISEDIPMNEGVYRPVKVSVPEGSVLNPWYPAAVSAGNVETSQRVVELILDAFRIAMPGKIPAQGQSTMNNLILGNRNFTYYETIGGGAGASSLGPGASGVHVHMTNTMNTPVESIEHEYPLRVICYKLRKDSGGEGYFRGGDGIVREIELLEGSHLSIQSERRISGPRGSNHGGDGSPGSNLLMVEGKEIELEGYVNMPVKKNWRVRVETPGGGGWGAMGNV